MNLSRIVYMPLWAFILFIVLAVIAGGVSALSSFILRHRGEIE